MKLTSPILINGILLLGAVVSWGIFLQKFSPAQRNADRRALLETYLGHVFAGVNISDIQLKPDGPGNGTRASLSSMVGRTVDSAMQRKMEKIGELSLQMTLAQKSTKPAGWTRIGEIHLQGTEGTTSLVIQACQTGSGVLGFENAGQCYLTDNIPADLFLNLLQPDHL